MENEGFYMKPTLYKEISVVIEQALTRDFNMVIDDFDFYFMLTPKMQTEVIETIFSQFRKDFSHFFDPCETGFTNEVIINLYADPLEQNFEIGQYGRKVSTLYFMVDAYLQLIGNKKAFPFLVLPKFSYFGDYQILFGLKNMWSCRVYQTSDDTGYSVDYIMNNGLPGINAE